MKTDYVKQIVSEAVTDVLNEATAPYANKIIRELNKISNARQVTEKTIKSIDQLMIAISRGEFNGVPEMEDAVKRVINLILLAEPELGHLKPLGKADKVKKVQKTWKIVKAEWID